MAEILMCVTFEGGAGNITKCLVLLVREPLFAAWELRQNESQYRAGGALLLAGDMLCLNCSLSVAATSSEPFGSVQIFFPQQNESRLILLSENRRVFIFHKGCTLIH